MKLTNVYTQGWHPEHAAVIEQELCLMKLHTCFFFSGKGKSRYCILKFQNTSSQKKNTQKTNTVSHCMVEKWLINSNKITNAFSPFLNRSTGLLDSGMLVNIQQPLIRDDGTVLMATDTKVALLYHLFTKLLFYYM